MKVGLEIGLLAVVLSAVAALVFWFAAPIRSTTTVTMPSEAPLPKNAVIDRLVVHKSKRTMSAYSQGKLLKTILLRWASNQSGINSLKATAKRPKENTASMSVIPTAATIKTSVFPIPMKPIKPTQRHKAKARDGLIKIHGIKNGWGFIGKKHLQKDWTNGCIAVTDEEVDELYRSVKHNAEIEILP